MTHRGFRILGIASALFMLKIAWKSCPEDTEEFSPILGTGRIGPRLGSSRRRANSVSAAASRKPELEMPDGAVTDCCSSKSKNMGGV